MSTIDTSTFNGDHKFKCFSAPLGSRGQKDFLVHSVKLCILLAQAQAQKKFEACFLVCLGN